MHKPIPVLTIDDSIRFWGRVYRRTENVCWPWAMRCKSGRSPYVSYNNQMFVASRVAYKLHYCIDPGELQVCHTCDNPICCNPHHLFLGTNLDNINDKVAKDRGFKSLGPDERRIMREMRQVGHTQQEIADYLQVAQSSICEALKK